MDYRQYKQQFENDGFVVVRGFLARHDLDELQQNLDRYIRDVLPSLPAGNAFYQDASRPETLKQMGKMGCDPYFARYQNLPACIALAEALLGEPVETKEPQWFNKPPGTVHPTPPHQDNYYWCYEPPNALTVWIALDAVDEENGCLRFVPGSHRQPVRPHAVTEVVGFSQGITDYGEADQAREVAIHAQPGDLMCHHAMTIHRADPNRSTIRHRRALALVMQGVSCRIDQAALATYQANIQRQRAAGVAI